MPTLAERKSDLEKKVQHARGQADFWLREQAMREGQLLLVMELMGLVPQPDVGPTPPAVDTNGATPPSPPS